MDARERDAAPLESWKSVEFAVNAVGALPEMGGRPIYLTIDVDVINPGEMPGTGSPEPGGPGFDALMDCIGRF